MSLPQGSDGYTSLFSLGELAPQFGGSNPQVLSPTSRTARPLGSTGFARILAAKDNFGGRYVSNLCKSWRLAPRRQIRPRAAEHDAVFSFGAVQTPGVYTLSSLEALPATTETVTYLAGGRPVTATFTGVSIWTLLTAAGIVTDPDIKNDILNYYLLATGSDGYEAILSLGELDPMFGGTGHPDLIAYMEDGMPLGADGFARLVVPGDSFGGRYVSNLVSLQVIDAVVPNPGRSWCLGRACSHRPVAAEEGHRPRRCHCHRGLPIRLGRCHSQHPGIAGCDAIWRSRPPIIRVRARECLSGPTASAVPSAA